MNFAMYLLLVVAKPINTPSHRRRQSIFGRDGTEVKPKITRADIIYELVIISCATINLGCHPIRALDKEETRQEFSVIITSSDFDRGRECDGGVGGDY